MKKYFAKLTLLLIVTLSMSVCADAQFVVKVRPGAPVVRARPVMPSPRHSWVAGEYAWRGGQYVYTDGYWAQPPHPGNRWVEGHWKNSRRGWVWIPGHWKR